jgi:hypothetical protein
VHHGPYEEHNAAILGNPGAPSLPAQLQSALEDERRRLQQFYQDIDDDMKAGSSCFFREGKHGRTRAKPQGRDNGIGMGGQCRIAIPFF